MKSSEEIGFLILNKGAKERNRLRMVNGIQTIPEDNNIKHGAVDRSDIDASVKRNLSKIRWCYEKELTKNSSLNGRIAINFIIDQDGSVPVAKINRSTMNNEIVEKCVVNIIKNIQFPAPRGGGIVIVNYPFVFKHSKN
jgi:TonB family protein